jgi:hypothetical protein
VKAGEIMSVIYKIFSFIGFIISFLASLFYLHDRFARKFPRYDRFVRKFLHFPNIRIANFVMNIIKRLKEKIKHPKDRELAIDRKRFSKAGTTGGTIAGLIGSLVIIAKPDMSGYWNISEAFYRTLWTGIIFFQIAGGMFAGWLCARFALTQRLTKLQRTLVFLVGFAIIFLVHQLAARDALVPVGKYLEKDGSWGGGPLGQPDFESLATGLMGGMSFLLLVIALQREKVLTMGRAIMATFLIATIGTFLWSMIHIVFKVLISYHIIVEKDFIISPAFFKFEFPHPERSVIVAILSCIYLLSIFISIRLQVKVTKKV